MDLLWRRNTHWLVGGFALVWCLGLFAVTMGIYPRITKQENVRARFQHVEGIVVSSEVVSEVRHRAETPGNDSHTWTLYSPKILYRYKVDGTPRTSSRVTFDELPDSDPAYARKVVAANPTGKLIPVYYDPQRPEESVLELSITPLSRYGLLFLRPFWGAGLLLTLLAFSIGILNRRIENYLAGKMKLPCPIPGWGTLRDRKHGFRIVHRPPWMLGFLSAYTTSTLISLLTISAVGISMHREAQRIALYSSLGISLAVGVVLFVVGAVTVLVDMPHGTIEVRRRLSRETVSLQDVSQVCVGWVKPRSNALALYLKCQSGHSVRLNVFSLKAETTVVARRAAQQMAQLLGKPLEPAGVSAPSIG
jgi:hypothetical protein